jgi:DNA-binding NarL/FixJ family response regulator
MERITVLIADDHELVRYALRGMIEAGEGMDVVGEAADTESAISECVKLSPDVLLLDMRMPGKGGVEVCRRVRDEAPDTRVLVLTSFEEDDEVFGVLSAGASGYLLKDTRPERIMNAIRAVVEGQSVFDSAIASRVIVGRPPSQTDVEDPLSERENEVLALMARGMTNRAIGHSLWIGEATVKTHVSHILRKLNQSDRTQAVLAAVRAGLVQLD